MTENTKIILSAKELELVCNTEWILTKHAIIEKVYQLFGAVSSAMESEMQKQKPHLPAAIFINSPKISKGENYRKLPYVMLDYPRYFVKDETLAIRTFFWWGNFFSVSLQISGTFLSSMRPNFVNSYSWLKENDFWIGVNEDRWQHHFETDNYRSIKSLSEEEFSFILSSKPFIKIAKKISLEQWQEAPGFIKNCFDQLAGLLKNH
jgi:hypothetical protein